MRNAVCAGVLQNGEGTLKKRFGLEILALSNSQCCEIVETGGQTRIRGAEALGLTARGLQILRCLRISAVRIRLYPGVRGSLPAGGFGGQMRQPKGKGSYSCRDKYPSDEGASQV